ncbi:MAG: hypothetical protein ACI97P_001450, partial [Arcticibacterium sp.]
YHFENFNQIMLKTQKGCHHLLNSISHSNVAFNYFQGSLR